MSKTRATGRSVLIIIQVTWRKTVKHPLFYVLHSDKTWLFEQPERAQGPIYIIKINSVTSTHFLHFAISTHGAA